MHTQVNGRLQLGGEGGGGLEGGQACHPCVQGLMMHQKAKIDGLCANQHFLTEKLHSGSACCSLSTSCHLVRVDFLA